MGDRDLGAAGAVAGVGDARHAPGQDPTMGVSGRGAIVEPAVAAGGGERVVVDSRRAAVMMQDAD